MLFYILGGCSSFSISMPVAGTWFQRPRHLLCLLLQKFGMLVSYFWVRWSHCSDIRIDVYLLYAKKEKKSQGKVNVPECLFFLKTTKCIFYIDFYR